MIESYDHFISEVRRHIEESNKKIMDAYEKRNISGVAEMYTEDCRVMPAGGHILVGRDGNYNNDITVIDLVVRSIEA